MARYRTTDLVDGVMQSYWADRDDVAWLVRTAAAQRTSKSSLLRSLIRTAREQSTRQAA